MKKNLKTLIVTKIEETLISIVKHGFAEEKSFNRINDLNSEYKRLPKDVLAQVLIKRAVRKGTIEGVVDSLGIDTAEAAIAIAPEPIGKGAAVTGVVALIIADLTYTSNVSMQLISDLAELYDCPYSKTNEEDVWLIFKAALGLKSIEKVASESRYALSEGVRKQFRALLRAKGIRKEIQQRVISILGKRVGKYLGEKYLLRLIPVVNLLIAGWFNNRLIKSVGTWAKRKAKVRSSCFKNIDFIVTEFSHCKLWVLPIIYAISTIRDNMSDNSLVLFRQSQQRLLLTSEESDEIENIIDNDDIDKIFSVELPKISSLEVRKRIFDIALIAASVDFDLYRESDDYLKKLTKYLNVNYNSNDLQNKIKYLKL